MFQASGLHERCLQVQPLTIFEISVAILCPQRQFKSISYADIAWGSFSNRKMSYT